MYSIPLLRCSFFSVLILASSTCGAVHVRDFGAIPNDSIDDAKAIQAAIDAALTEDHPLVELDAGDYLVTEITGKSPYNDRRVCLAIDGAEQGFTLRGTLDAEGKPATALIYNEAGPRFTVEYWMWVSRSKDVVLENLLFDFPGANASGRITKVGNGRTWVELWPEVVKPKSFIQGAEYVFLYDPEGGEIVHEKITVGAGWDEITGEEVVLETPRDTPMASLTEGHGLVLDVEVGEVGMGLVYPIQWHHAPEKTFVANQVENLTLRNLTIVTALGHILLPVGCENITVQNLQFDPAARGSNRGWVSRRDGLTMRACKGDLLVEDSTFQRTSDDMLAFWGFQFHITKILSPTRIEVTSRQAAGDYFLDFPLMIEAGDWIEFRVPTQDRGLPLSGKRATIRSAEFKIDREQTMDWTRFFEKEIEPEAFLVNYVLELEEPLPDFVADASTKIVLLGSTLFDSAVIRRVTTRDITNHPGVLIPGALDYTIEDSEFYTEVELSSHSGRGTWHGGAGIWSATIRNNTFGSSSVVPHTKGLKADTVVALEPRGEVVIEGNRFIDGAKLEVSGTTPIQARGNTFAGLEDDSDPIQISGSAQAALLQREGNVIVSGDTDSAAEN
ncbi:hypothetical protein [Pelagicoccus sp. SDUM812002]|uniref:hypothetical protein n=1 Tax=Pelagicoccus sp. SDUM812002 TaxID=3041266 RepID=UPI00280D43C7|nr:hypothetical protein [Pelagicoccus sp. SDUM812002]MDQ8184300.1 hypothetical protein [Pelagicoccus sp. SDUM812002]